MYKSKHALPKTEPLQPFNTCRLFHFDYSAYAKDERRQLKTHNRWRQFWFPLPLKSGSEKVPFMSFRGPESSSLSSGSSYRRFQRKISNALWSKFWNPSDSTLQLKSQLFFFSFKNFTVPPTILVYQRKSFKLLLKCYSSPTSRITEAKQTGHWFMHRQLYTQKNLLWLLGPGFSPRYINLTSRSVLVEDKVAFGQVLLLAFRFSPVSIITLMLCREDIGREFSSQWSRGFSKHFQAQSKQNKKRTKRTGG